MKRTPLKSKTPLKRKTPLRAKVQMKKKRMKPRRNSKAIRPWREWYDAEGNLIRLVCNEKNSTAGRERYNQIRDEMYWRDKGICGWCLTFIPFGEHTFDHADGRTGGRRNDLAEYAKPDGTVVKNRCLHWNCNSERSSMRFLTRAEWLESRRVA